MSTLHFMLKHERTIKNIYNSLTVFLNDFIHVHVFGNKQFLVTFIDNVFFIWMRHWIDSLELVLGIWTTLTIPWLHWYRIIIAMLFLSIWLFWGIFVDTSKVRLRQHCLVVVFYFLFCFRVLGFLFCLFNIFLILFKNFV